MGQSSYDPILDPLVRCLKCASIWRESELICQVRMPANQYEPIDYDHVCPTDNCRATGSYLENVPIDEVCIGCFDDVIANPDTQYCMDCIVTANEYRTEPDR